MTSANTCGPLDWNQSRVQSLINDHSDLAGGLLPLLHGIQASEGFVPPESIPLIADGLNLSKAEVHGVVSFYHHFRTAPSGRHTLQVCRAESCQAMGSRELESHIQQRLGIGYHQTTSDQEITLEPVYCLGNCGCSPSLRVGDDVYGDMTPEKFDQLHERLTTQVLEFTR